MTETRTTYYWRFGTRTQQVTALKANFTRELDDPKEQVTRTLKEMMEFARSFNASHTGTGDSQIYAVELWMSITDPDNPDIRQHYLTESHEVSSAVTIEM